MKRYFEELEEYAALDLSLNVRNTLIFCFHSLQIHQEEVKLLEKQIYIAVENIPAISEALGYIEAMPGMQTLSKISVLVEVGMINRFPKAGDVAVYAGIAPRGGTSGIHKKEDTTEKTVVKDRPNKKCNRILKTLLVRAVGVIFRMCDDKKDVDDICRYASRFPNRKKDYFKKAFKVAAKWIRKLFFCLTHKKRYDPLVGLDNNISSTKKSRSYRLKKKNREFYQRNRAMRYKIENIYEILGKMGISTKVLNELRNNYALQEQLGGITSG